jgi:hypothetical protein
MFIEEASLTLRDEGRGLDRDDGDLRPCRHGAKAEEPEVAAHVEEQARVWEVWFDRRPPIRGVTLTRLDAIDMERLLVPFHVVPSDADRRQTRPP